MPQLSPNAAPYFHSLFVYTRVERRSATAWDACAFVSMRLDLLRSLSLQLTQPTHTVDLR